MKVKMLTSIASAEWSHAPGEEVDVDEQTALAWAKNGFAEVIKKEQPKKAQDADQEQPEEEKPKRGRK